jgi:hypothetical protein
MALGLGLLMAASGCRSTRNEVPPGRPFAKDGQQRKAIEFSSEGHPVSAAATTNLLPNNLGGSNMASGIGGSGVRPDGSAMGGPPGAYGPPGSAPTDDSSITRATGGSLGTPPPGVPPLESAPRASSSLPAQGPAPEMAPPRDLPPMESPAVLPPVDAPGGLGSPGAPPSSM